MSIISKICDCELACVARSLIDEDRDRVLPNGGVIIGDSGTGAFDWLLKPLDEPKTVKEVLYNFLHSSTRMTAEQTFGIWKNRFRFLQR